MKDIDYYILEKLYVNKNSKTESKKDPELIAVDIINDYMEHNTTIINYEIYFEDKDKKRLKTDQYKEAKYIILYSKDFSSGMNNIDNIAKDIKFKLGAKDAEAFSTIIYFDIR